MAPAMSEAASPIGIANVSFYVCSLYCMTYCQIVADLLPWKASKSKVDTPSEDGLLVEPKYLHIDTRLLRNVEPHLLLWLEFWNLY